MLDVLCIPRGASWVFHSGDRECGKARAAGASPGQALVHRASDSVFNCLATRGCIAGPQLIGVQGKSDVLLLPAEKLLWAVGMG